MKNLISHLALYTKNESRRLFHGRGKIFPEFDYITLDFFKPYLLITFYRSPNSNTRDEITQALLKFFTCEQDHLSLEAIIVQDRSQKMATADIVWEKFPGRLKNGEDVVCEIEGAQFLINFFKNRNIGFFFDMQLLRQWLLEHSKDKKVLNLFSYTCALSIFSLMGGAREVHNYDMSRSALNVGKKNHHLNGMGDGRARFFDHNILKSFGKIDRGGPYDLIILDPPSDHGEHFNLESHYYKIVQRVLPCLNLNGILVTAVNSPHISLEFLLKIGELYSGKLLLQEQMFAPDHFLESDLKTGLKVLLWKKI